jgi:signal transduction histidine kinase
MRAPSDDSSNAASARPSKRYKYQTPPLGLPITEEVSGASRRLRALAALSGSLTDSLGPDDAADLVEQQALSALGATSAVVVTLGPFPPPAHSEGESEPEEAKTLYVVHAIGLAEELKASLQELPLDAPVPFAEVARTGQPLFLSSEREFRRYPDWAAIVIRAGTGAAAIVPVWANGELRGVLGLNWPEPHIFDEDERAFVLTLGVMCAQAIMRAHLRAAERKARESAERANRSKARFLATISHELRTPINAVMGYTELLVDEISGPVSALQKTQLGRVRESGNHLLGLIDDLLGYARIEAGEEVVRAEPVLLADIVEQSLVLVRPLAEKKKLHIRVEAPSEPTELLTDARKLRQILVNLLANAVKFSDRGEVVLLLRLEGSGEAIAVIFEITDAGRGIATADHDHVFDAFWQQDPAAMQLTGGTGLGLSVARQLARLLGGEVTLSRSSIGNGSTFTVSLPARYKHVAQDTNKTDKLPDRDRIRALASPRFVVRLHEDGTPNQAREAWVVNGHSYRGQYIDADSAPGSRRRVRLFHPNDNERSVTLYADELEPDSHPG